MGGMITRILKSFEWHSSPIDWCEPNYAVHSGIAEFYNTVSNAVFIVLPCLLLYLFHPFARGRSWRIQFVWLLNIVVGFASAYFHATLSLAGQLLDEFGILWVFGVTLAFWMPKELLPRFLRDGEDRFAKLMLTSTVILTVFGCFWPVVNSFVLMSFSLPCLCLLIREIRRSDDAVARFVAKKAIVLWFVAVAVWMSDRFACGAWRSLWLPGGHWLWHLLVAYASYHAIVFVAYSDALHAPGVARPVIRFWPTDRHMTLGVAYVQLKTPLPEVNGNVDGVHCKNC